MLIAVLLLIVILWILDILPGINIAISNSPFFFLNGRPITLINILTFFLVIFIIKLLPSPIRQILIFILTLRLLSLLGIFTISGFPNALILILVIVLLLHLIGIV